MQQNSPLFLRIYELGIFFYFYLPYNFTTEGYSAKTGTFGTVHLAEIIRNLTITSFSKIKKEEKRTIKTRGRKL